MGQRHFHTCTGQRTKTWDRDTFTRARDRGPRHGTETLSHVHGTEDQDMGQSIETRDRRSKIETEMMGGRGGDGEGTLQHFRF